MPPALRMTTPDRELVVERVERVDAQPASARTHFRLRAIMRQGTAASLPAVWEQYATIDAARAVVRGMYSNDRVLRVLIVTDDVPPRSVLERADATTRTALQRGRRSRPRHSRRRASSGALVSCCRRPAATSSRTASPAHCLKAFSLRRIDSTLQLNTSEAGRSVHFRTSRLWRRRVT